MNTRDLGISGGAGKGDSDRSPGWRDNYDEIGWPARIADDGTVTKEIDAQFKRRGSKLVKKYGAPVTKTLFQEVDEFMMGL